MKEPPGGIGFFTLVQGAAGPVHQFTDRDRGLVHRAGFADGCEIYAGVALVGPALALFAAAASRGPGW
ncbi:hypothetical protein [Streptomyces sp. MH13]|uniref:hypothetical protein n=1 Tax=Streptomyces sp. MH13 TaxID=3417651 RepID=UPI003CFA3E16